MATSTRTRGPATKARGRKTYKSPLADIEFEAASDIIKYADTLRMVGRAEQLELHTAADELQAILTNSVGNVFERMAAKRKAKKVANQLRAAAESARAMATDGVRLSRAFKREYAALMDPPKKTKKRVLNWKG